MEYREVGGGDPRRTFAPSDLNSSGDVGKLFKEPKSDYLSEEVHFSESRTSDVASTEQT